MMSLSQIHEESRRAARVAARNHKRPVIIEQEDLDDYRAGNRRALSIPFLGDYTPKGFKKTENLYFVDSSGCGGPGEPALTMDQFISKIVPGCAYAVVEAGQFQVYVQEFEARQ